MGFLRALGLAKATADLYDFPSPLQSTHVPSDVLAAWGVDTTSDTVSRKEAMSVPAVRRGRAVIAGTIGTLPLTGRRPRPGTDQLEPVTDGSVARLLSTLDPATTPSWTLTWLVDDLMFRGRAWWRCMDRDPSTQFPTAISRVDPARVNVDVAGRRVYVDGLYVPDSDIYRFDGPDEGILSTGAMTLRTAILLERAVRRNATGLPPQDFLRPAEGAPELSDTQIDALLDDWADAREDHGTAFLSRSVEHGIVGFDPRAGQLAEARLHQASEVARLMNLDPDAIGAPSGGSMTYANVESKRRDLIDVSLRPYMVAIEQRLSMGDITPRGTVVTLDTAGFLRGTTSDAITAGAAAVAGQLMTREEVRVTFLGLPATPTVGTLDTQSVTPAVADGNRPALRAVE